MAEPWNSPAGEISLVPLTFPAQSLTPKPHMKLKLQAQHALAALALALAPALVSAQDCQNGSSYPFDPVTPDPTGGLVTISECNYLNEYSPVGPVQANVAYEFTASPQGFITVREGSVGGPVLGAGFSPLVVAATQDGATLYVHWNDDAQCGTSSGTCITTTVQQHLDCLPPMVTVTAVDDCDNNQFSLHVNVTSLGDAGALDLVYTVNGGSSQTEPGVGLGEFILGPFTVGAVVNLVVEHDSDPTCNRVMANLSSNNTCPTIIQCGEDPLDQTYCYVNYDNNHWTYESSSNEALILIFSAGWIESQFSVYDHLWIYDGEDDTGVLLWQNVTGMSNLAGVQVIAPSGKMYMKMTSDVSGSCGGSNEQWEWQVGCLDCTGPAATFNVVTDCVNFEFSVDVDITLLGSDPTLDIINAATGDILATATSTGVHTVGPFEANVPVVITLSNSDNSLCNVSSEALVNPLCPQIVQCGTDPIDVQYCYDIYDSHSWSWESSTGDQLMILFSAGSLESSTYDWIRIYDGNSTSGTLLFQNPNSSSDLAGVQAIATSGMMYMEMGSDGSLSCTSGYYNEWVWQVGCMDCASPQATFNVVTDCDTYTFSVDVDITVLGSDPTLDIINAATGDILATATSTGVHTVGPFVANIPVVITLSNSENSLCNISSESMVNPLCPQVIECGGQPIDGQYCYGNSDSHAWSWESSTGDALIIIFSAGSIESNSWDHIRLYNGNSNNAPLLYENPLGATNLAGVQVIATSGMLYMEMSSDGSNSCASGTYNEWVWQIGCLDCTSPTATFSVVTDCDSMQYFVDVNITQIGSDPVLDITNNNGALPVVASATGTYTVGPFPAGTTTMVTLENDVNPLCNVSSDPLTNPLCPTVITCGGAPLTDEYCYGPNDSHEWAWQSSDGSALMIQFSAGWIESQFTVWDHLYIYDGVDVNGMLIYENVAGTTSLAGVEAIAGSGNIYMRMTSDGSGQCNGTTQPKWEWSVGCMDCTSPSATYSIVEDCMHHSFQVAVNIEDLGNGASARIANSYTTDTLTNIPLGIYLVGPFPMDSTVSLTVLHESNDLCRIYSPEFTSASLACVDTVCDPTGYTYCYTNNDTAWFAYQGDPDNVLTIQFLWGRLMVNDFVQVWNGLQPIGPPQWQGNLNGDIAGWYFTSSGSTLLMRVVSDGAGSCATGEAWPELAWYVGCGAVGIDEVMAAGFAMYPNPTTGELTVEIPETLRGMADLRVTDVAGRVVHTESFANDGGVQRFHLGHLQRGNYVVTITTQDWVRSQKLQIMR